jgi:hypothetical protein
MFIWWYIHVYIHVYMHVYNFIVYKMCVLIYKIIMHTI